MSLVELKSIVLPASLPSAIQFRMSRRNQCSVVPFRLQRSILLSENQKVVCDDCLSTKDTAAVNSARKMPFAVSIGGHLKHQQGTWTSCFNSVPRIPTCISFPSHSDGRFLYLSHRVSKLEAWLEISSLKFNADEINTQGW